MPHWDYASNGIYFITLVTQHRECALGHIDDKKMILSDFGKIVDAEWHKSFQIREELFLNEYVIMPNHLHAIVVLKKNNEIDGTHVNIDPIGEIGAIDEIVETHGRASLLHDNNHNNCDNRIESAIPTIQRNMPVRKPKSLSSFVAGFKSAINSKIDDYIDCFHLNKPKYNKNNPFFQPNYHDHIIRNAREYEKIKNYILNNPINWKQDTLQNNVRGNV
jgi:REP element-mobilizing transposase RayT